jgi:hypothetical protein
MDSSPGPKAAKLAKTRGLWAVVRRELQNESYIGEWTGTATNDDDVEFLDTVPCGQNRLRSAGLWRHSGEPIACRSATHPQAGVGLEFDRHDRRAAATQFHDDARL